MKITITTRGEDLRAEYDYRQRYQVKFDDEVVFDVSDGEPEDSNLSRDFNDVFGLPKIFGMLVARTGTKEDVEVVQVEAKSGEEF